MAKKEQKIRSRRLCVFCGSSMGARPGYRNAAVDLGDALGRAGIGLVFGGGHIGLMGVMADAALAAGGEVIGVIPQALVDRELAHRHLTKLSIVRTMHERKAKMAEDADAFAALPGGFGTLDEFFEVLTWAQLGIHSKPCLLLNTDGFFDPLLVLVDFLIREGFVKDENRGLIHVVSQPGELISTLTRLWGSPETGETPVEKPVP